MSKEFGHLPVNINDYFNTSLKKKNSVAFPDFKFIESNIIKGNNNNTTLGLRSAYTILWTYNHLDMEQENQWKSGQLLATMDLCRLYCGIIKISRVSASNTGNDKFF